MQKRRKRRLTAFELQESILVFGASLGYDRIWIVEGAAWPNWLPRLGAWLSRKPAPTTNNSVTLGNVVYSPVYLRTSSDPSSPACLADMAWLIHELTHVWQFQHVGAKYIFDAIWAHIRLGDQVYAYGGAQKLGDAQGSGVRLEDFNPEQQGDIVRDYYLRCKRGIETSAWDPLITQLRQSQP